MTNAPVLFSGTSTPDAAKLEFVFQVRLHFTRVQNIENMPSGAGRGAVYVDSGNVEGPAITLKRNFQ